MDFGSLLFSFRGRIGRAEFWIATLLMVVGLVLAIAALAGSMHGTMYDGMPPREALRSLAGFGIVVLLLILALLVMNLAVCVKRLHDLGLSGWLVVPVIVANVVLSISGLVGLSSIANIAFTAYLGFAPGQHGSNRFGPPKGGSQDVTGGGSNNRWFHAPMPTPQRAAWEGAADNAISAALARHTNDPAVATAASVPATGSKSRLQRGFGRRG